MRTWMLTLPVVAVLAASLAGCQAPCDRMCDARADYINACVEFTRSTMENDQTPPAGWGIYDDPDLWWSDAYGVADADEYASMCKADADDNLGGLDGDDTKLFEQECEGEALLYEDAIEETDNPSCHLFP